MVRNGLALAGLLLTISSVRAEPDGDNSLIDMPGKVVSQTLPTATAPTAAPAIVSTSSGDCASCANPPCSRSFRDRISSLFSFSSNSSNCECGKRPTNYQPPLVAYFPCKSHPMKGYAKNCTDNTCAHPQVGPTVMPIQPTQPEMKPMPAVAKPMMSTGIQQTSAKVGTAQTPTPHMSKTTPTQTSKQQPAFRYAVGSQSSGNCKTCSDKSTHKNTIPTAGLSVDAPKWFDAAPPATMKTTPNTTPVKATTEEMPPWFNTNKQ